MRAFSGSRAALIIACWRERLSIGGNSGWRYYHSAWHSSFRRARVLAKDTPRVVEKLPWKGKQNPIYQSINECLRFSYSGIYSESVEVSQ